MKEITILNRITRIVWCNGDRLIFKRNDEIIHDIIVSESYVMPYDLYKKLVTGYFQKITIIQNDTNAVITIDLMES